MIARWKHLLVVAAVITGCALIVVTAQQDMGSVIGDLTAQQENDFSKIQARFANRIIWPAIALVQDRAEWGYEALAEIEEWFEQFAPVLPVEAEVAA